jgi:hypothetical protein
MAMLVVTPALTPGLAPGLALGGVAISGSAALALAPLLVLALGLVVYCLVDIARSPQVRLLPKPAWAVIVVLVSTPLGALAYLIWGRDHHDGQGVGLSAAELEELAEYDRDARNGNDRNEWRDRVV